MICEKLFPNIYSGHSGLLTSPEDRLLRGLPFHVLGCRERGKSNRRKAQLGKLIRDTDLTTLHAPVYVVEVVGYLLLKEVYLLTHTQSALLACCVESTDRRGTIVCMGLCMPS